MNGSQETERIQRNRFPDCCMKDQDVKDFTECLLKWAKIQRLPVNGVVGCKIHSNIRQSELDSLISGR